MSAQPGSVLFTGANTLDVVEGMTDKNRGLLLRVKQEQKKGENGWLKGRFEILAAGSGPYAEQIWQLQGQSMNAKDFIENMLDELAASNKKKLTVVDRNGLKVR